jgi:hypothetical protein
LRFELIISPQEMLEAEGTKAIILPPLTPEQIAVIARWFREVDPHGGRSVGRLSVI